MKLKIQRFKEDPSSELFGAFGYLADLKLEKNVGTKTFSKTKIFYEVCSR